MPAVCRIGDELDTGHICDATTTIDTSATSGKVKANGIAIIVVGAMTVDHGVPPACAPHAVPLLAGSGTVSIEGIPVGRIGDAIDDGAMTTGSPNVNAG